MSEQHMHYAIDVKTQKRIDIESAIHTSKGGEYICECCGKPLYVRKGAATEHVFYHAAGECTDKWNYEFDDPWHIGMQKWLVEQIPGAESEVVITAGGITHRTDVCMPQQKVVIELQHSPMDYDVFAERNFFYTSAGYKVIWIFDKIKAFHSGDISQDNHFEEWYHENTHGRVLVSKENSSIRRLFQNYESQHDVFVFFQKNHVVDNTMVFEELCYSKTVMRQFDKRDGPPIVYTRTLYVTAERAVYPIEMLQFLQSTIEPVTPYQYDFSEEDAILWKHSKDLPEKEEEPDTDRKRPELDEARSPETTINRLLELANLEDETGALGKALLINPKVKKLPKLQRAIIDLLKQNLTYPLAEMMVNVLDDEDVVQYVYSWSLQNQEACVKRPEASLLRYYIATKTQSADIITKLSTNKGDMIRVAVAQNPITDRGIVYSMVDDVSMDVAYAAAMVLDIPVQSLQQRRKEAHAKLREERKQAAEEESRRTELRKREKAVQKTETEARKARKQAEQAQKRLDTAHKNIERQRAAISKRDEQISALNSELQAEKRRREAMYDQVDEAELIWLKALHPTSEILAKVMDDTMVYLYNPDKHYIYRFENYGSSECATWRKTGFLNLSNTYNDFYRLPREKQKPNTYAMSEMCCFITDKEFEYLIEHRNMQPVARLRWVLSRI